MSMTNHLMRAAGKPRASITAGKRVLTPSQASLVAAMRSGFRLQYSNRTGLFCLNNPARQGVTYSARVLLAQGYFEKAAECSEGCEYVLASK